MLPVARSSLCVLIQLGSMLDGQRNVATRVDVTVEFIRCPGPSDFTEIEKFAALYSDCCSTLGSSRTCVLKSPLIRVVPSEFREVSAPGGSSR